MKEGNVLNAKNKGSMLEIKNKAPCYWVDRNPESNLGTENKKFLVITDFLAWFT
jgi:hypothetical protein